MPTVCDAITTLCDAIRLKCDASIVLCDASTTSIWAKGKKRVDCASQARLRASRKGPLSSKLGP
eukprot:1143157-Pelagomonas_calceolata.AAC.2